MEDVKNYLESIGYVVTKEDEFLLIFCFEQVVQNVKTACNISDVPPELSAVVVHRTCGEFLGYKIKSGKLDGFDMEQAVKSVQLGDSSITFSETSSAEDKLLMLSAALANSGESELICYRKIKW